MSLLSQCSAKKKRYSSDSDLSFDFETPSLSGLDDAADGKSLDGPRNAAQKRVCPSASGSNDSFPYNKKLKQSTDTALRESSPDDEEEEEGARRELMDIGVRVLEKREVDAMTGAVCDGLGSGAYGSCCKTVEPHTQQEVVIKIFLNDDIDSLLMEAKNLHQLQMWSVQRLMGVCIDTCYLLIYFAGNTADHYLEKPFSFVEAATIFLQVGRALRIIMQKGFTHNDLKGNNACVSDD